MVDKYSLADIESMYDAWAQDFQRQYQQWADFYMQKFIWYLKWKRIIDLGCWICIDLKAFLDKWYDAIWIDISQKMLDRWKQNWIQESRLIKMDIQEMDKIIQKNSIDWIWAMALFIHMDKEIAKNIFKKMYDSLKSWWISYISVKEKKPWENDIRIKESLTMNWFTKRYVLYDLEEIQGYLQDIWYEVLFTDVVDIGWQNWISLMIKK